MGEQISSSGKENPEDDSLTASQETPHTPSYREVLQHQPVKTLSISRFAAKMAASTLTYGVMVYLAREGASQFQISMASSASFLAALLFGMQGGAIADTVPKQRTLMLAFLVQAAICFTIPVVFGTGVAELLLLIFVASALAQVITPGLKSAVALVATPEEVATTGALVSVVGSIGSAIGSAFLAPILIKVSGIEAVIFATGLLYLLGAVRIRNLPEEAQAAQSLSSALKEFEWKSKALSLKYNANWIMQRKPVASMMIVGIMVTGLFEGFNTLIPAYIRDVLDSDPANAVYIFAPAGIGFLIGAVGGPWLIALMGERKLTMFSLVVMSAGMILLGMINTVAPWFAWMSPMQLLEPLLDIEIDEKVLAAGVIAIPANFGSTAAGAAVQAYINKTVPVVRQGGMFGMQEVQKNAFNLTTVFLFGVIASFIGSQYIFIVAPFIVLAIATWLVRYSFSHVEGEEFAWGKGKEFIEGK